MVQQSQITHRLLDQVEFLRLDASRRLTDDRRSELGQFLTPPAVARLMASMLVCAGDEVVLLDAGAGVGSLLCAAVEQLCNRASPPRSIQITAYEIDPLLQEYLHETLILCQQYCLTRNIACSFELIKEDFIQHSVDYLANPLFAEQLPAYTCAILNPPYRKIRTDSRHRQLLSKVGIETSNLYTAFLALTMRLLAPAGELVAITPRSFCNGSYFRPFREQLLNTMELRRFHVFESREQAFQEDDVLQENIILSAARQPQLQKDVIVTTSFSADDEFITLHQVNYDQLVLPHDPQCFIHLISDQAGQQSQHQMASLATSLADLGITVSTGRVVDFRAATHLRQQPEPDTAPLIYPLHVTSGRVVWPKANAKKPNALVVCAATRDLFVANGHYVLVKRFSAKEEHRRVAAVVHTPEATHSALVGFENHLNYFHVNGQGLDAMLACGLAAFLNSTLVDTYFRQFSGHTQVNATDLRAMRYPTRQQLITLGQRVGLYAASQDELDAHVAREIFGMSDEVNPEQAQSQQRIVEALDILRALGFPRPQLNERSALTLLALAGVTPNSTWADAHDPLCGITPMMEFFAQQYGKTYKPNTRETVRRQTVHQFLEAGLIVANPDAPARPTNSPKAVYQIDSAALALLRSYGTEAWERQLRVYLANVETLKQRYARERAMQRIPVTLPNGQTLSLSPGSQNVLIKLVLEEFAAKFTPGGEVLYIGDTDEKFGYFDKARLEDLGVTVEAHGKMPDVIIFHAQKQWLVLVEAVTSHGPIDPKRRDELAKLFSGASVG
ncbi:MAG: N-6 DNA methylase, partial [Chloroflexaceae bacterium]|nr:N-6 DNA methylase [Chloroflexaceae bacterium]